VVRQDLAQSWTAALVSAGFDPQRPAAFLAEGLLYYLDEEAVTSMFDALRTIAAPGSWLGVDMMNREVFASPFMATYLRKLSELGCPWKYGNSDPGGFLASRGWQSSIVFPGEPDANYGRWVMPVIPRTIPGIPRTFLIRATRLAD
jgi:methyltransferase (TIGR00027 family)